MDTKTIVTPIGKYKVELKSFVTGREKREMKSVYLKGMNVALEGEKAKAENIDMAKVTADSEDASIRVIVVSINGQKNKIKIGDYEAVDTIDAVLSMKSKDTDFVIAEINKVTNDDDFLDSLKKAKDTTEQES